MMKVIMALAWPTMLEQLLQTAVQYIDTAMVSSLSTQEMAAVGATTTVGWLIGGMVSAFGVGFLSFIARACGANDRTAAARATAQAVVVTLTVGVLFTAVTLGLSGLVPVWMQVDADVRPLATTYFFILYLPMLPRAATIIFGTVLRAAGDTKTPMKVGIWVNLINVVLNFLLIFPTTERTLLGLTFTTPGAGMGVTGAAIASAIAVTVGGVYITAVLWRHPMVSPRGQKFRPDWSILRPTFRVALPNMLQRFGTSLGYVAFASMINGLGSAATAAHSIANTVESAFYIPGYGMQTAAATLAGNAYGAKDADRMKRLARMFIPIEVGLMILSGGLLFFLAPPLAGLFAARQEPIVRTLVITVLQMVAVSEPFYGFSIIVEGMMQGVGRTKQPFIFNVAGMWLVRILGTWICTTYFFRDAASGLIAAWACMIAHNLLLFVLFLICYVRGTWNPLRDK
ncbi:MAG: MATE family efflux transporter [Clostridiales bacterium]|nr:MATE family efflux transporter [Clostridiales bacterium]